MPPQNPAASVHTHKPPHDETPKEAQLVATDGPYRQGCRSQAARPHARLSKWA